MKKREIKILFVFIGLLLIPSLFLKKQDSIKLERTVSQTFGGDMHEIVLVDNYPHDTTELYKMALSYLHDSKIRIDSLIEADTLNWIDIFFYKNNYSTRKTKNIGLDDTFPELNGVKNILVYIIMSKYSMNRENNCLKWKVIIKRNLGYSGVDENKTIPATSEIVLDDRCDPQFYEKHKDNEIVRYYHELFYPNDSTIEKWE